MAQASSPLRSLCPLILLKLQRAVSHVTINPGVLDDPVRPDMNVLAEEKLPEHSLVCSL